MAKPLALPIAVCALVLITGQPGVGLTEFDSDHHEHPGITDQSPDDANHRHGDEDDHHSGPDSPCHHHVFHCGCAQNPGAAPEEKLTSADEMVSIQIRLVDPSLSINPSVDSILHVPIA